MLYYNISNPNEGIAVRDMPVALDPLELYARGIDGSDFVATVGRHLQGLPDLGGRLLDVGAGAGQLTSCLVPWIIDWTALEPDAGMRSRLRALPQPPTSVLANGWEDHDARAPDYDCVLASNIAAPLAEPKRFLEWCRGHARRTVIWVVPAQHGPRGLCLAGCLPAQWHGEDETPGVRIVMSALAEEDSPQESRLISWTFSLMVDDLEEIAHYLAERLHWAPDDVRRPCLLHRLRQQARSQGGRFILDVPRISAVLVWRMTYV